LSYENLAALPGVVPALALVDPDLPAVALDQQRMRAVIQAWRDTSPERAADDLRAIGTRFFTSCLGCGLAMSMQALANNDFVVIGRLLRHPELYADSFWLGLALKAVAAVLLRKVIALRALAEFGQQTGRTTSTRFSCPSPETVTVLKVRKGGNYDAVARKQIDSAQNGRTV
jgi:hypothetical protein